MELPPEDPQVRRYSDPAKGLEQLESSYNYWSEKITDLSFQCCIALIAANWAVHSDSHMLLGNIWALLSVGLSLLTVLLSLVGALVMSFLHKCRFDDAETDRGKWRSEWESSERIPSRWPYSDAIETTGLVLRLVKVVLPIASGFCFVGGIL